MDVRDYIAHETERQSGTMAEAIGMYIAWGRVHSDSWQGRELTHERVCLYVSDINGITGYRNTPVVFHDGGTGVHHQNIVRSMDNFIRAYNSNTGFTLPALADELTKEFLEIHPFVDGNGRVASLLWNRLRGTLDDPQPMPYFFGEGNG